MSIETISAGQRDWVKTLNDNFAELGKQATEVDVVLGDGFTSANNDPNKVMALPLPNGKTLKIMTLNMKVSGVQGAPNYNSIAVVPDGFGASNPRPVGIDVALDNDGHFQGTLGLYFLDATHLGGHITPLNNGESGPFNYDVRTTILYY